MEKAASRYALQAAMLLLGSVATAAGLRGMVRGAAEVIDGGPYSPNIDSEYRFYAAWYHVAGIALLLAARQPERSTRVVHGVSAAFFGAACARLLSARTVGRPHALQRALMGIEFAIPMLLIPWQRRIARGEAVARA